MTPTKNRLVRGSSRQVSHKIFCWEQRLCMSDPKTLADKKKKKIGTCVADSDKLSGAGFGSTNSGSEYIFKTWDD